MISTFDEVTQTVNIELTQDQACRLSKLMSRAPSPEFSPYFTRLGATLAIASIKEAARQNTDPNSYYGPEDAEFWADHDISNYDWRMSIETGKLMEKAMADVSSMYEALGMSRDDARNRAADAVTDFFYDALDSVFRHGYSESAFDTTEILAPFVEAGIDVSGFNSLIAEATGEAPPVSCECPDCKEVDDYISDEEVIQFLEDEGLHSLAALVRGQTS